MKHILASDAIHDGRERSFHKPPRCPGCNGSSRPLRKGPILLALRIENVSLSHDLGRGRLNQAPPGMLPRPPCKVRRCRGSRQRSARPAAALHSSSGVCTGCLFSVAAAGWLAVGMARMQLPAPACRPPPECLTCRRRQTLAICRHVQSQLQERTEVGLMNNGAEKAVGA